MCSIRSCAERTGLFVSFGKLGSMLKKRKGEGLEQSFTLIFMVLVIKILSFGADHWIMRRTFCASWNVVLVAFTRGVG